MNMAGSHRESVLDFDLELLHENDGTEQGLIRLNLERQRRTVENTKKRIIASHALIDEYKIRKAKLAELEKNLFDSKEECKQVCIDYRNALQKITYLEESEQKLRSTGQELEERCIFSENKYSALQSHTNQLQLLVKDYETKLEAFEIENQFLKTSSKECEKSVSSIEREKNVMFRHILVLKDIVLGKQKPTKKALELLKRYKGKAERFVSDSDANDSCIEAEHALVSWQDEAFTDYDTQESTKLNTELKMLHLEKSCNSPSPSQSILEEKGTAIMSPPDHVPGKPKKPTDVDHYSDGRNQLILSIDTGRGSSLAFSDSENCFLSPDHFNDDSPPNSVAAPCTESNNDDIAISQETPPCVSSNGATSIFDEPMNTENITKPISTPKTSELHQVRDTATSPMYKNIDTASNALRFVIDAPADDYEEPDQFEEETPTNGFLKPPARTPIKNTSRIERQCLESNKSNSILFSDDNSNDFEVSTILNKMSLHYSLITPLPQSPTSMSSCSATENTNNSHSCKEAAEIREENKVMQASIASLAQQMMEIKSLLKHTLPLFLTDDAVPKQTSSLNPDTAENIINVLGESSLIKTKGESQIKEPILVHRDEHMEATQKEAISTTREVEKLIVVAQKEPILTKREVDKINEVAQKEPTLTKREVDKINEVAQNEPVLGKKEVKKQSDIDILSEMQTPQYFSEDHDFDEVGMPISSDIRGSDEELDIAGNPTVDHENTEVELDETSQDEELLIELSDLCDTVTIANSFNDELFGADESYDTPENNLIDSNKSEGRLVERLLFDDPKSTDGANSEEENVQCSEEQETLSDNCDINLKIDDVCNNNHSPKKYRKSKLTKLEKIRKRLQPKSKIKMAAVLRKPIEKRKRRDASDVPPHSSPKTELNDKAVYEKALAVVAELRAKQKTKNEKARITRSGRVHTRSESKPLESIKESKRVATPQILKFRQSPRLHAENKDVRTPSTTSIKTIADDMRRSMSPESDTNSITTRSRRKAIVNTPIRKARKISTAVDKQRLDSIDETNISLVTPRPINKIVPNDDDTTVKSPEKRSSLKRPCVDTSITETKRKLRSSIGNTPVSEDPPSSKIRDCLHDKKPADNSKIFNNADSNETLNVSCKDYSDLDMFTDTVETETQRKNCSDSNNHPKESILCKMIEKHGVHKNSKFGHSRIPANITNSICNTLEKSIASIKDLPTGACKAEMDTLVDDIKGLPYKHFLSGLTKFLKEPARKAELFNKIVTPPAPPMSKPEQILLYLISEVKSSWAPVDIVDEIMKNIEFSIFRLSQSPDFDVIESLSHFYAVLCRFSKAKNRLRLFILDAMYCLSYKSIPLIKTCIDVWMHVLPLAHMGIAKSPLVICIVYLLHYYKCNDYFNRVQEIRFLLKKRYSFEMTEWNETRMLDLLKNAIMELRENATEKKMLRIALIILAKRQGTKWCQNNIIKRMLLPLIDTDLPERVKDFCVAMLGPLMKPYPNDMKVHCEIVLNQLFDMLENNSSQRMQEAIFTSLLYIQRHDPYRVTQALLTWRPQREISRQLEDMLREFVREKPIKMWTRTLANYSLG